MKIYNDLSAINNSLSNTYVTIGNFDGVHLGHQRLFREVVERAYREGGKSVVVTFDPHPLQVLRPDIGIKLISSYEQKVELIEHTGIDVLVVIPFTREFAATTADDFVDDILVEKIRVKALVVGYDYAFGKGRQGNIEFLREKGKMQGFPVSVVEPFSVDDMLVSSTKVRELVSEGRMRDVKKLLGRNYQIRGEVQKGRQRGGAVVGFPTANLHLSEEDLVPRHGVYVTQVIYDGRCYGGVLNIGYNPTFDEDRLSVETHIFDFNEAIYGKKIKINLLQYLRGEVKFDSVAQLSEQIRKDIGKAKSVLDQAQKELLLSCEEIYNRG